MSTPRITELAHWDDVARRFRTLGALPWAMWLDSAAADAGSRFDVLVADPYVTVRTRGATTEIATSAGASRHSERPPFELVREQLGDVVAGVPGLPFAGGAVGYFGYDLGRRLERIPSIAAADIAMPDLAIGLYDWAVVVDHAARRTWLVGNGRDARTFARWPELVARLSAEPREPQPKAFRVLRPPRANLDRAEYAAAFRAVQEHIRRGDCYQVNLTQRFEAEAEGDAWHAYLRLRQINPAPFAAYLDLPDGKVVCSSPERFLQLRDGHVETKPIKGTRPRSPDAVRDRALADELRASAKDRAENVMIVDLLRNDLGKCCVPGSVRASKLFDIESYASVHQLVSTVEGQLAPDKHALDLVAACFPGGSITGAPKVAAMKIIEELEPQRRSVYCGSIGYIGFDGNMDLNIAIRTLVQQGERVYTWAGGGVVADSKVDAEYQESLDKAAAMLAVMDSAAIEASATIERAAAQDVLAIREVLRETWHDTYASILPKTAIETITSQWHAPALLAEQIQDPDVYFAVARDGGVVAGVVTAQKQNDAIVVNRLYVRPHHQRRGIGRQLLESCYRAFRDAQKVRLTVEADNRKGVAFYTKQGFREVARSSDETGARLENVVMEKTL